MKLTIAVANENYEEMERMREVILSYFSNRKNLDVSVDLFQDGASLIEARSSRKYDVIFLDICVKGTPELQTARILRFQQPSQLLVFMISSTEHYPLACAFHAFDCLLKPFRQERVFQVLGDVMRVLFSEQQEIEIRVARNVLKVKTEQIAKVISEGHNVYISLKNGREIRSIMPFRDIQMLLSENACFLSCNRGIILNMHCIKSIKDEEICMADGSIYPLRVRDRAKLIEKITNFIFYEEEKELGA